eukprot:GFUD01099341.1.p1 GENE.GFUD01099341.1~~GFUD01099341.1.p1  ORF type:complete len:143 (-),score=21.56 GFUD01099341.1:34-462(-)
MESGCLELIMRNDGIWTITDDKKYFLYNEPNTAGLQDWRTSERKEKIISMRVSAEKSTKELTICKEKYEKSCLVHNKSIESSEGPRQPEISTSPGSNGNNSDDMTTLKPEDNQKKEDTYSPIYIGGGLAVLILRIGAVGLYF